MAYSFVDLFNMLNIGAYNKWNSFQEISLIGVWLQAEWAVFKRNAEEMRGRLDKQENELVELRDVLTEKRKQLVSFFDC